MKKRKKRYAERPNRTIETPRTVHKFQPRKRIGTAHETVCAITTPYPDLIEGSFFWRKVTCPRCKSLKG